MKHRNRTLFLAAAALLLLVGTRARAATFTVTNLDNSGPGSLRQTILNANSTPEPDIVAFTPSLTGTIKLTGGALGQMDITGNVEIRGPGGAVTIDADGKSRIFTIAPGVSAEIRTLTLTRGKTGENGGAIHNSGSLILTGCTLSNNHAGDWGGGAVFSLGDLTLTQCSLTANTSAGVGAVAVGFGAPIEVSLRLSSCFLTGNRTADVGGALFISPAVTVTMTSTILSDNTAGLLAGGMYNGGTTTMSGCVFTNNRQTDPDFNGGGCGACWNALTGVLTAENCSFSGNSSARLAGAMLSTHTTMLTNCTFSNNSARSAGGAVWSMSDLVVDHGTFSGNSAPSGGAIFHQGDIAILTDSTFSGNSAGGDGFGGGAVLNDAVMSMVRCTLSGNGTSHDGGAVFNDGSLTLTSTLVSGNSAGEGGGGILSQDNLTLVVSRLLNNRAAAGGGILSRAALTMRDCTLSANFADLNGGAILKEQGTATLTGCIVFANFAATTGGGIHNEASELTLLRCTIAGNSAVNPEGLGAGGGLFNRSALTVRGCTVNGNIAREGAGVFNAGGLPIDDGGPPPVPASLIVVNSTVSGNTAGSVGGGLLNQGVVFANWCTVFGNRAEEGGGLRNLTGGLVRVGNTIFASSGAGGNTVNDAGGTMTSLGHNLDDNGTGGFGAPGDRIGTPGAPLDPKLGPLQNNGGRTQTHALAPGSPAIDAGDGSLQPEETDQRGWARIVDGNNDGIAVADIGAYELGFFGPNDFGGLHRDGLLTYSTIQERETSLPAGTGFFPLTIHYSADIAAQTFVAKLNGQDISHLFNPGTPDGFETVQIPLRKGENRLILRVKGRRDGKPVQDVDNLGFRVGGPPYGPR